LLLHDIQVKTVEALPNLLRELKRRGYKIVQVVPATPDRPKTATEPSQWQVHAHQAAHTPVLFETEPELPAPNPASFGLTGGTGGYSWVHRIALPREPSWQPLPDLAARDAMPVSDWPEGFEATQDAPIVLADDFNVNLITAKRGVARSAASRHVMHALGAAPAPAGNVVAVNEIQHLLETLSEQPETPSDGDGDGPVANAVMPRGAFP
jgi:hypothetical protein